MNSAADGSDLSGHVAVVTGGSRGIGRAVVEGLAKAGADVVIASRKLDNCERVAKEIEASTGRQALPVSCHVGRWEECDRLVETVYEEFGRCDVLVNNAGMAPVYDGLPSVTHNLVMPGAFDTDISKAWGPEAQAAAASLNPMQRIGQPEDMVGLCVFLASKASGYINGAQVLIDGGLFRTL